MAMNLITCPDSIQTYLTALYDAGEIEAVRRVAEAGPERWTSGGLIDFRGRQCLLGHAGNVAGDDMRHFDRLRQLFGRERQERIEHAFDAFAVEVGDGLAGAACSAFARSLLENK
jgi:hypothetical protein